MTDAQITKKSKPRIALKKIFWVDENVGWLIAHIVAISITIPIPKHRKPDILPHVWIVDILLIISRLILIKFIKD